MLTYCSSAMWRMTENMAIRMGNWIRTGRQPLKGLTFSFLYSSMVFMFFFSGSFSYLRLISSSLGLRSVILRMAVRCFRSRGMRISLTTRVKRMMATA